MGKKIPLLQSENSGHRLELGKGNRENVDPGGVDLLLSGFHEVQGPLGQSRVQPSNTTHHRFTQDFVGGSQGTIRVRRQKGQVVRKVEEGRAPEFGVEESLGHGLEGQIALLDRPKNASDPPP